MKYVLGLVALTAALNAPAHAQDSQSALQQCSRGWLAKDWPTVAIYCMSEALRQEQDPNLEGMPAEIQGGALLLAGVDHARAAVAYGRLHKESAYNEEKSAAIADLTKAVGIPGTHQKWATQLLEFLQSSRFLKDAPDSDLMGTT